MNRARHVPFLLSLAAVACLVACGCSRPFWRNQANRDAYNAIAPKLDNPRWALPRIDVNPDPRSRMFHPYDPDRPPLPPGDPAAAQYMQCVAGMEGYQSWHEFGRALANENPHWEAPFAHLLDTSRETEVEEEIDPELRLTLDQLLELSYIHNREYQTQIENLFLAALDLTFDRFQFAVRYLDAAGREPGVDLEYENVPGVQDGLALGGNFGVSKLFPSGAQMAVEIANETLWLFAGPDQRNTASLLSYTMVQPLLFGAGRRVVLEDLTQSERNVLYAARDLARFRREFFVATVAGGGSGGYLGLLQQRQEIRNVASNIGELQFQLEVLAELEARPPQRLIVELRETAAPLLDAEIPEPLADQFAIRQLEGSDRLLLEWVLPMTEAQAAALEQLVRDVFEDEAVERITLGLIRAEITRPARAQNFVELAEPLPEEAGFRPGEPLPGEFAITVPGGADGPADRTYPLAAFGRYEADEVDGERRIRLTWFGPMLGVQEDALLALSDNAFYHDQIERLAAISRASEPLAVTQLQSELLRTLNRLRSLRLQYRNSLDRYKIELGLPPDVLLPINECLLASFQLVDPRLSGAEPLPDGRLPLEQTLIEFVQNVYAEDLVDPSPEALRRVVGELAALVVRVREQGVLPVGAELQDFENRLGELRGRLDEIAGRERLQRDYERDRRLYRFAAGTFNEIAAAVEQLQEEAEGEPAPPRREQMVALVREMREELLKLVRELRVIQIGVRVEGLELNAVDVPLDEAVSTALVNRVDLMNARARVVDARRQVEVAANRLEAVLDVRAEGEIRNPADSDNPLDFRGARSSYRFGLAFTAPLDQVAERNAYRASLIALQRARRDYTEFEDEVKFQIRENWRQLAVLEENFEVSRQALRTAARQLDQASEATFDPAGQGGNSGLNLLNALNSVLGAQNDLIGTWVNYERARLNLFRDMGIMEIGADGVWNEPFYRGLSERCRRLTQPEINGPPEGGPPPPSDEAAFLSPRDASTGSSAVTPTEAGRNDVDVDGNPEPIPLPPPLPQDDDRGAARSPGNGRDAAVGHARLGLRQDD